MFRSATLKLTAWYLAGLMSVSLLFSAVVYQVNYHEVDLRLRNFQDSIVRIGPGIFIRTPESFDFNQPRRDQIDEAGKQIMWSLVWVNSVVLILGGIASYLVARRTLDPIQKAHEAQSRFTSDASHELRTPLAAMKTELEVSLKDTKLSAAESRELLKSTLEEVNSLISLSETLLKLSRLDYDKLERTPVDVVQIFSSALEAFPDSKDRVTLTTRKKALVEAHEPSMKELCIILLDNAFKHSPDATPIHARIYEQRGNVGLEITNEAAPLSSDDLDRMFERFTRGDQSRTRNERHGYGLGLSIARKIVDIHHGVITAKSNSSGVTMTVSLPILRKVPAEIKDSSLDS